MRNLLIPFESTWLFQGLTILVWHATSFLVRYNISILNQELFDDNLVKYLATGCDNPEIIRFYLNLKHPAPDLDKCKRLVL